MMAKCAGGDLPGHRIVAALQRAKAEKEETFYQTLVTADNLINKQTQASEDIAKARKAKDGQGLSDDWENMRKIREKQQMDDAERARQLVTITHIINTVNTHCDCYIIVLWLPIQSITDSINHS